MLTYWTNFAKRGDPNGEGVPAWPAFREAEPHAQYFNGNARPGSVPSESSMKVLDEYFSWRRSPAGAVAQAPPSQQRR
jgi:para-nitrobenzyl esterase